MKVALITPWKNAWIPHYEKAFTSRGHRFGVFEKVAPSDSDIVLHGWAIGTPSVPKARNIVFLRGYELFDGGLARVDWKKTHALICVNPWAMRIVEQIFDGERISTPVHLVYNAVNADKWTFAERKPGKHIGMACHVHLKKNLPLAAQIVAALPDGYELHIAGAVQDFALAEYLTHFAGATGKHIRLYGELPASQMDEWWNGMDYCLSTSIREGNPNNVIEAMAKGIKPIVHCWPGAEEQFQGAVFRTVEEAVAMIISEDYRSSIYRDAVKERFSLSNIERVVDLALEPMKEAA